MSPNEYAFVQHEMDAIAKFADNDAYLVQVPIPAPRFEGITNGTTSMLSELYYF